MQNDSFKMRQHYAPYNRSEESHRKSTAVYSFHLGRGIFRLRSIRRTIYPLSALRATSPEGGSEVCLCERSEAISREGGFPQDIYFFTSVVGYFAIAQYDVLLLPPSGEVARSADRG